MFADVHSHVLFGMDDGAKDPQEARELLSRLHRNGVTHLALTPHYYPYKRSLSSFLEKRACAMEAFSLLPEAALFTFALGAEVYLSETLLNNSDLTPLCFSGTRFMLVEPEYAQAYSESLRFRLLRLTQDFGIRPILAHIDRYPFLWKNQRNLEEILEMGCLFQVNLSALIPYFSSRRAVRLYDKGLIHFLGEDVHHQVLSSRAREKAFLKIEKRSPGMLDGIAHFACSSIFD